MVFGWLDDSKRLVPSASTHCHGAHYQQKITNCDSVLAWMILQNYKLSIRGDVQVAARL